MTAAASSRPAAEVAAGLGPVLGVWTHPDDEAYLCGGLMAAAAGAGARVVCVTGTRGERGTRAALRAQASQVDPLIDVVGEDVFGSWVANECFRPAAGELGLPFGARADHGAP